MKDLTSKRMAGVEKSTIREVLKLTEQPDIISLAGGLPAPETFPNEELADIAYDELAFNSKVALQYSVTEGSLSFRKQMARWLTAQGINVEAKHLLVTSASQQGLDLIAKAFIDPGDVVLCGLPTYLGAIQAFRLFEADLRGILLAEDGMDIEELKVRYHEAIRESKQVKAIYVVPDFQNPSGITMSLEKRKELRDFAYTHGLLIIEDNPYGWLRFEGEAIPSIMSMDIQDHVIMLITFSKILAAGLRLAVIVCRNEKLMDALVRAKQPTDLCTSIIPQRLAGRFIAEHDLDKHIEGSRHIYKGKRDAMVKALEDFMPDIDCVHWTNPQGGLFLWMTLSEHVNTDELFKKAIEKKVAFLPGSSFFVDGSGHNTMRLAFSIGSEERIREGIERLSKVVIEAL